MKGATILSLTANLHQARIALQQSPRARAISACLLLLLSAAILLYASTGVLGLFPVKLHIAGTATAMEIQIDGQTLAVPLTQSLANLKIRPVEDFKREYQIDGSDSTNNFTLDTAYFAELAESPYYRFQSLLRDEDSYSRWQNLVIRGLNNRPVLQQSHPVEGQSIQLPQDFQLSMELHRMEIPRALEFTTASGQTLVLEINRNDKYLRLSGDVNGTGNQEVVRSYFPQDWLPAAAELIYFALRTLALGLLLVVVLAPVGWVMPAAFPRRLSKASNAVMPVVATGIVLAGACYSSAVLFDKAPHILDAISYYCQGQVFASGSLSAPAPPVQAAFPTPFTVAYEGQWFSQYPPGAPLLLAIGFLVGLPWLVEPLLATAAALLVFFIARRRYGRTCGNLALVLMATSPFLILMAGSFMSHVPAMFFAALFLYAAARYVEQPASRWILLAAAALGFTFLSREITALLYGLPVGVYALYTAHRRHARKLWPDLLTGAACLALFAAAYAAYNWSLTGVPWILPRMLFYSGDTFGFGQGIGFYGQHTFAAGLVNTDELLTSLSIVLFGWPFYFSLAMIALPFVLRRADGWDRVCAIVFGLFVLAYIAYFYHGIALGPRYYFEALPVLVLLTARGLTALASTVTALLSDLGRQASIWRGKSAVALLITALLACNFVYFAPRQIELYQDYAGLPGRGGPQLGSFVAHDRRGRTSTLENALVVTNDWWIYVVYLAPLNAPRLDGDSVFALATNEEVAEQLRAAFPDRDWYDLENQDGMLVPVQETLDSH